MSCTFYVLTKLPLHGNNAFTSNQHEFFKKFAKNYYVFLLILALEAYFLPKIFTIRVATTKKSSE